MASTKGQASVCVDAIQQPRVQNTALEDFQKVREKAGWASPEYDMRILEAMLEVRYNHRPAALSSQARQDEDLLERHIAAPLLNQGMSLKTNSLNMGCEGDYMIQASRKAAFQLPKLPAGLTAAMLAIHGTRLPDVGKTHVDKLYDSRLGNRERVLILMEHGIPRIFLTELLHEIGPPWHPGQGRRVWRVRRRHEEIMVVPHRAELIRLAAECKFEGTIDALGIRIREQAGNQYPDILDERLHKYEARWTNLRNNLEDILRDLRSELNEVSRHQDSFLEPCDHDTVALPKLRIPKSLDEATKTSLRKLEQDWMLQLEGTTGQDIMEGHGDRKKATELSHHGQCLDDSRPAGSAGTSSDLIMPSEIDFDEEDRAALAEIVEESRALLKEAADFTRKLESRGIEPHKLDFNAALPLRELEKGIRLWDNHPKNVSGSNAKSASARDPLQYVEDKIDHISRQLDIQKAVADSRLKGFESKLETMRNLYEGPERRHADDSASTVGCTGRNPDDLKTPVVIPQGQNPGCDWRDSLIACVEAELHRNRQDYPSNPTEPQTDDPVLCGPATSAQDAPSYSEQRVPLDLIAKQKNDILLKSQRKTHRSAVDDFLEAFRLELVASHEKARAAAAAQNRARNADGNSNVNKVKSAYETPNRLIQEAVDDLYEASRIDEMAWRKQTRLKKAREGRD